MFKKGILSLGLCTVVLAAPVSSFAAEENSLSVQPKVIHTEFGYTDVESGKQPIIKGNEPIRLLGGICMEMEGGNWCKGQKYNIIAQAAQYSNYDHDYRVHKSTAMANDKYRSSGWVDPGEPAESTSDYYYTLNTYKSYYDVR
ncbi:lactococcin 972 family bacteriocin [Bacillus thuringiensis]|uniref:lactococcin 972 family bacteriocin n=1 Tax=Bacillus thuringiensis TaxID=1428 RepID=UPI003DA0C1BE